MCSWAIALTLNNHKRSMPAKNKFFIPIWFWLIGWPTKLILVVTSQCYVCQVLLVNSFFKKKSLWVQELIYTKVIKLSLKFYFIWYPIFPSLAPSLLSSFLPFSSFLSFMQEIRTRALYILSMHFTTELHPSSDLYFLLLSSLAKLIW